MVNVYTTPEHTLLRDQIARFIAREVEPHAQAWEDAGMVPRAVLRKMGATALLGLMYEPQYGGAEADAMTNLVFAEALSQSAFGGFIITVLMHTDMASPHLHHAGTSGWLSSDTAELVLHDVRIPADNLFGEQGKGFYSVMKNFQTERIALAAMAVGQASHPPAHRQLDEVAVRY